MTSIDISAWKQMLWDEIQKTDISDELRDFILDAVLELVEGGDISETVEAELGAMEDAYFGGATY